MISTPRQLLDWIDPIRRAFRVRIWHPLLNFTRAVRHALGLRQQSRLYGLYQALKKRQLYRLKKRQLYRQWIADGRPIPPPNIVKQDTVIEFARRFKIKIFIETGTYLGEMVNAVKETFPEIYSVELGKELFERARKSFAQAKHITILHGDSGEILGQILDRIQKPCLFRLDGHFSEGITARGAVDTTIKSELTQILKHPMARRHVMLIDDARLFTGEFDYPTIQYLKELVAPVGFSNFEVRDDIICIFNSLRLWHTKLCCLRLSPL